jgi:alpha-aminoadipic semialdehyde synthase
MIYRLGIRREDKNEWEKRVPLSPTDVGMLKLDHGILTLLQPFPTRAYSDAEFQAVGAEIDENLADCPVILGVKEMPSGFFRQGITFAFFSHVIKGQSYNMPMLKRILDVGCNLIDYEKITDDKGVRLVFFGREAGQAGMVDTLWSLGERLCTEGIENPFAAVKHAIDYHGMSFIEIALALVAHQITTDGIPDPIHPVIIGFAGYGNVSRGAQAILDHLPVIDISPEDLLNPTPDTFSLRNHVYKVVFKEEHMAVPRESGYQFELQDYYKHPERYVGVFERYVPHLTVLMNCIYWSERYPRLVTTDLVRKMYSGPAHPKLKVIGDISCDLHGAIEVNMKTANPGNPVYVYDVNKGEAVDGVEGDGPVILAVDNLPAELPREATSRFSHSLTPLIPDLVKADFTVPFENLILPPELKRAVICHRGQLTPDYEYLREFLLTQ